MYLLVWPISHTLGVMRQWYKVAPIKNLYSHGTKELFNRAWILFAITGCSEPMNSGFTPSNPPISSMTCHNRYWTAFKMATKTLFLALMLQWNTLYLMPSLFSLLPFMRNLLIALKLFSLPNGMQHWLKQTVSCKCVFKPNRCGDEYIEPQRLLSG